MSGRVRRFFLRVGALAAKEAVHIQRDPRTLYLALVMPVVMLLIFGFGVSFDIDHLPIAVVDLDKSETSRDVVRNILAPNELVSVPSVQTVEEAETALRAGRAYGYLVIPANAGRDLAAHRTVAIQLVVDGRDGVVATQLLNKAEVLVTAVGAQVSGATTATTTGGGKLPFEVRMWTRFNPENKSAFYMVPGLSAYLMAIASVMLTALAIATEWERGSMEQLFASPVGRLEIILGKLIPYLFIGALQLLLVIAAGAYVFDVPVRGSIALLFGAGGLFLLGMLGQGLLISVLTRNQLVATQAGALSSLLPSLLLSGFVFPIENMPRVLQLLSSVIPARYMVHTIRGIMLKGVGFADLWPDFAAMAAFAFFILLVSTVRFKRRLA